MAGLAAPVYVCYIYAVLVIHANTVKWCDTRLYCTPAIRNWWGEVERDEVGWRRGGTRPGEDRTCELGR